MNHSDISEAKNYIWELINRPHRELRVGDFILNAGESSFFLRELKDERDLSQKAVLSDAASLLTGVPRDKISWVVDRRGQEFLEYSDLYRFIQTIGARVAVHSDPLLGPVANWVRVESGMVNVRDPQPGGAISPEAWLSRPTKLSDVAVVEVNTFSSAADIVIHLAGGGTIRHIKTGKRITLETLRGKMCLGGASEYIKVEGGE